MLLRYSLGTDLRATTLCVFLRCDARLPLGPLRRATHAHALLVPDPPALFWAPLPTSVCRSAPALCVRRCAGPSRVVCLVVGHTCGMLVPSCVMLAVRLDPTSAGVRKRDAGLTCVCMRGPQLAI